MKKVTGIYKIESITNPNKIYVGSSESIYKRWKGHISDLERNKHGNSKLQNHFNKYGLDDLKFIIIEECDIELLLVQEQYYIDLIKPFFNICVLAESRKGIKASNETKEKISSSKKGSVPWNKGKKGLQASWNKGLCGELNHQYGKKKRSRTDEEKKKISESLKGNIPHNKGKKGVQKAWNKGLKGKYKTSDETKQKISKKLKGRIPWNKGKSFRHKKNRTS